MIQTNQKIALIFLALTLVITICISCSEEESVNPILGDWYFSHIESICPDGEEVTEESKLESTDDRFCSTVTITLITEDNTYALPRTRCTKLSILDDGNLISIYGDYTRLDTLKLPYVQENGIIEACNENSFCLTYFIREGYLERRISNVIDPQTNCDRILQYRK